jgi:hypothetical protein
MWILISMMILISQNVAQAQTFTDSTFNNADWSTVILPVSTAGSTSTTTQVSGGNPSPSRTTTNNITIPTSSSIGQIIVAHTQIASSYDPAVQGAIVKLSYAYDLIQYNPPVGGAVGFSVLIFQNNTYYRSTPIDSIFSGSWQTFSNSNLTAASFIKVSGPSTNINPDFSCTGARIQFGYVTANSNNNAVTRIGGIDNWKVTIEEKKPCGGTTGCGTISDPKVKCDKGAYTYTFTVTNNSTQVIQYLLLSPPPGSTYTISPNVINLGATPLASGQSTNVTVSISNASPGKNICINVALADKAVVTCCTVQTCIDLPECASCLKLDYKIGCDAKGTYTVVVSLQNLTGVPIQQVFVIPTPSSLNVSPQLVTLPTPLQPNQTATLTLTISGASPGTNVCLRLTPYNDKAGTCCSAEICFTLPSCVASKDSPGDSKKAASGQVRVALVRMRDADYEVQNAPNQTPDPTAR